MQVKRYVHNVQIAPSVRASLVLALPIASCVGNYSIAPFSLSMITGIYFKCYFIYCNP